MFLFRDKEILSLVHPVLESEEEILLWLEIPSIQLKEEVYPIYSSWNQVSFHVQILEDSNLEKNIFFFAAHSGYGDKSYFNDIILLEKGDFIFVHIGDRRFMYVVSDKYFIDKDGYFYVGEVEKNSLYLITCSRVYLDKQVVVVASMISSLDGVKIG